MNLDKKFDIFTIIVVVLSLITLSIGALMLSSFVGEFGDQLREDANEMEINQTYINDSTDFIANDVESFNDNYVFWFFVATFIGLILTAMYLEFEPAIMIIIFFFGAIAVLGAWLGTEIYSGFTEDVTLASPMTKTAILMGNPYFPVFIFIGLVVMMIIMYSKKSGGVQ